MIVLLFFAVILPPIVAFTVLQWRALPVPYQDDYNAILNFGVIYDHLSTPSAKMLAIATEQHNEYKLVFEHLIFAGELSLTHHFNFAFLTTLGNLFLLLIGYMLWRVYQIDEKDPGKRLLAFLPISILFFSITYWETLNWSMTSLQQLPVVFFALLSICFLFDKKSPEISIFRFCLACTAAILACCASANGFLLLPVGLLILLPCRYYVRSFVWTISFVPILLAYLYRYIPQPLPVTHRPPYFKYITRVLEVFAVLGGVIPQRWIAVSVGIALMVVVGITFRSCFNRTNPVPFYFTLWVLGTALMIGWGRGSGGVGNPSRYTMYSLLMLIFCYSFFSHCLREQGAVQNQRRFYVGSLVVAVVIFVWGNRQADKKLEARREMVYKGLEFYRSNPAVNSPLIDPVAAVLLKNETQIEKNALDDALRIGIYTLPSPEEVHKVIDVSEDASVPTSR